MSKRKPYKPKPIINPALRGTLKQADAVKLNLTTYQALDLIAKGHGSYTHYDCLRMAVCVSAVLCERGYGIEYIDLCNDCFRALLRMSKRAAETGKFLFDGEGLNDMRKALDVHSQQIEICRRTTLSDAIFEAERRLKKQRRAA